MGAEKPSITLIPWDPESTSHIDRLVQQRKACGWSAGLVESWRDLQRKGSSNIQWIVLSPSSPDAESRLEAHIKTYPRQSSPLTDSAAAFGGKPRDVPSPALEFHPVGHISLDITEKSNEYLISTFYVSTVLQGSGIGRVAMETVEHMATSPPLSASMVKLMTMANRDFLEKEKWVALGRDTSKIVSKEDWYGRMGYVVYGHKENAWSSTDKTGKIWWHTGVMMQKVIV